MNFYGLTDKGNSRKYNEDAVEGFIHEDVLFLMIGDGQGSHLGGQSAADLAILEIRRYLEREYKRGMEMHLQMFLEKAIYLAHRVIEGVRKGDMAVYSGLCTALTVVAITRHKQIFVAHIGNTKIFLYREGQLIQTTKDHTLAQNLFDQGKILITDLPKHPERGILTKAIGVFDEAHADFFSGYLVQGDVLLLVTDGITEHLSHEEIAGFIQASGNNQTTCENLIMACNERGGWDNVAVISTYINF